jgi:chromosome segregation ATPase|tara:strand:+ start:178 stop:843 length:666 start_codon:yes stop_codon:yes gene_type:complete
MTVVAAGVGAAVSIGGGIFGASRARKEARRRERQAKKLEAKLNRLEANRQQIINPYEGVTSLSGMLSNPFEKLTVATKATELQIEQTDQALANTLDTLRATGASAGGATALAQAALQSKKGVAADIERQESANNAQRLQGEATLMQQKMSEEQRMQQADVAGKQFVFNMTEQREMQQLDRLSNQIGALRGAAAQARADQTAAITGAIGSVAGIAGSLGGKL